MLSSGLWQLPGHCVDAFGDDQFYKTITVGCPSNSKQGWLSCICKTGYLDVAGQCRIDLPAQAETGLGLRSEAGTNTCKPIFPATGEETFSHSDFTDTSPHTLSLTRTFRSRWSVSGAAGFAAKPGLGQAWAHNHSSSLSIQTNTGASGNSMVEITSIRLTEGNGSIRIFEPVSGTNQFKDSSGPSTITAGAAGSNSLPTSYTLKLSDDDSTWQFDASGKLQSKTERNGWTTSYSYIVTGNGAGQLGSITNAFGRSIQLSYNTAGQLESATLPDGQTVRYTFDSSSRISNVRYSDNSSKVNTATEEARAQGAWNTSTCPPRPAHHNS